jgi:lipid A 3-O-deacylase
MDGRFAIIFAVMGLTDTALNDCPTGCLQQSAAPAQWAVQYGDLSFQDDVIGQEVYATYDLPMRYGAVQPSLGVSLTSTNDFWVGMGAKWTTARSIDTPFFIEASLLPGIYVQGDGPDLGGLLEFRGALGLGYRFDNGASVTLITDHRSNADLGRINPGLETYGLRVSLPVN